MKRNTLRTIIGGLSFTTAMFVFQACYGTPQALDNDFLIEGQVTSRASGQPIQNIRVGIEGDEQYQFTNLEGRFSFYTIKKNNIKLMFEDTDPSDGQFPVDTLINPSSDTVIINISLIERVRLRSPKKSLFLHFRDAETRRHELNYLFWECTLRCNLNCLHCGSDCSKNSELSDMPLPDLLAALKTILKPAKNFMVVLTGGEPLLRNDIEECGREIRKMGMQWSLVSNGLLYTPEKHNALINAGLGALTISLDGMEDTHNWLRNGGNTFDRVSDAIRIAARCERLNFDVVSCVNPRNLHQLEEMKQWLENLGVKSWRLFSIAPIGRAAENPELMLSAAQLQGLMKFIAQARKKSKMNVQFSCEAYTGKYESHVRDGFFFCRAGINIGSILADGSISACPNNDKRLVQGNIYSDNFYDIWNTKFELFRNREWTRKGICATCSCFDECLGSGLHLHHGENLDLLICHKQMLTTRDKTD